MLRARYVLLEANDGYAQRELEDGLAGTAPFRAFVAAQNMRMDAQVRVMEDRKR